MTTFAPITTVKARALIRQLLEEKLLPVPDVDVSTLGNVPKFGGMIFPAARTRAALQEAFDSIGAGAVRGVYLSRGDAWAVDAPLTVPAGAHLQLEAGAVLTKSGTGALTINGHFSAPPTQVFSGFSSVRFAGPTERVLPQWFGAKGDGTTDDTAAIQAAFDCVPVSESDRGPREIYFPPGRYLVTSPGITVNSKQHLTLSGGPDVQILYGSNTPDDSVLNFNACLRVTLRQVNLIPADASASAKAAIRFGSYLGQHVLDRCVITGSYNNALPAQFDRGVWTDGTAGDANNDHFEFHHCRIETCVTGVYIGHTQSKAHKFYGCVIVCRDYGVFSVGSYFWLGGAMAGHAKADFFQATVVNNDPILIAGLNSESSARLFATHDFTADGNLVNAQSTNGNSLPVTIMGVRFDTDALACDGIEEMDGRNARVRVVVPPTANELDGAHGTVGWGAVIHTRYAGPINLIGCRFGAAGTPPSGARRAKVLVCGTFGGWVNVSGCAFIGDDPRVSAVLGTIGGNDDATENFGPFTLFAVADATGCQIIKSVEFAYTWPVGASCMPMPAIEAGSHYYAQTESRGWPGGSFTLSSSAELVRLLMYGSVTGLTIPDGQSPGQEFTLLFVQDGTGGRTVAGWSANVAILGGTFNINTAPNAMTTISFKWDGVSAKWVEVSRAGGI